MTAGLELIGSLVLLSQTHNIESWVAVIKKGHAEFLIGLGATDGI